jgi:hypothetical protein
VISFLALVFVTHSAQLTFLLELDKPAFNFTQNALNDSSLTKDIIFSGNENKTVWIRIPKNSTILDSRIDLKGVMKPIQSSTLQQIYSLAVGDVNFTNEWDEIAIGTSGPSYIRLLNATGSSIWSYSVAGDVYGVAIGNLSSDEGNEVVAGSTDYKIYLLNSSGNEKWNVNIGNTIYDIDAGNVIFTNEFDEIAVAAADNRVYLFDSSGLQIWNYTGSNPFKGVAIGNLSSDEGNEVVAGSGSYIYLLNSSGNEKWNVSIGTGVNDVDVGNTNPSNEFDEIAVAGNNGTVFLLDASGNILWSFTTSGAVDTVSVGEVTSDTGDEIVAGSYDDKVYVLNATGSLIWSYTTENDVRGVGIGNLTSDAGNEVAAGTNVPATYTLHILNFEYYPTNVTLNIGNDSSIEWQFPGKFRTTASVSNNTAFQNALSSCSSKSCDIPLVFHSDYGGDLNITSVNISYQYNISDIISSQIVDDWSRTTNVRVNESVGNQVKNLTYTTNPAVDIRIDYIKINDTATRCDFNGTSYPVGNVGDLRVCNISTSSRTIPSSGPLGFDKIWDDTMSTGIPLYINESQPITEFGFWKKNLTIWNDTSTIFYNIIANTTINDTIVVANPMLKVDWYSNGTLYDITPSALASNCNTTNPTYTAISVGNDVFYVCKQDTNGNGVPDLFVWKQPHSSTIFYEVSGSSNHPSDLTDLNVTPSQAIWGSEFNFSANVTDVEGDNVTVRLWVYLSIPNSWEMLGEKNITANGTVWFNVTSNKTWSGNNLFKFEYADFNSSTGYQYHSWQNTTNASFTASRHNVSIIHVEGNDTSVNRTDSVLFIVMINDTDLNENVSGVNCSFWVTTNDTHWYLANNTVSNETGHCNYTFAPNAIYSPGQRWWRAGTYQDLYYQDQNSTNYSVKIYGKLNINLTTTQNFTRGGSSTLLAKLYDEFNSTVQISGYNCSWYINDSYKTDTQTNSSGYCNYTWSTGCADALGVYPINVTLSGSVSSYYFMNKTEDVKTTTLKDNLNLTIISPLPNSIIHRGVGEVIYLNSTLNDSCGSPYYSYNITWTGDATSDQYPNYCNKAGSGDNITWSIGLECPPGIFLIKANATGEFYHPTQKNVSVWIYGWSGVNITYPANNSIINRTENQRTLTITCFVFDFNNSFPNEFIDNYPVDFWDGTNYLSTVSTNSTGYAKYTWNISDNTTVPDGQHTIKCNISDTNVSYYRYYNTSKSEHTVFVIIRELDTTPPTISGISFNSTTPGGNVTIEVNVTDWYEVDKVWMNLTYPNSTSQIIYLQNTTPNKMQTIWRYVLQNLTQIGDYDFVLYANDTSNLVSSNTSWFEVYLPIQMYLNSTIPFDVTFYRVGSGIKIHEFGANTTAENNWTLHKRNYDLLVNLPDTVVDVVHTIKFNNANTTASSELQFNTPDANITNPFNFSIISVGLIEPPRPYRNKLASFEMKTNFVYSNVSLTINYSIPYSQGRVDYESNDSIKIYRCVNWTANSCTSGWSAVSDTVVNTNSHTVSATVPNTSTVYFAVEEEICGNNKCGWGESCSNCPGDCGICPSPGGTTTGGGGGGGGGGISPICGNRVCEAGETQESCPEDCGGSLLSINTNASEIYLYPGEVRGYSIRVQNLLNKNYNVSLSIVGSISPFLTLEKSKLTIKNLSTEDVGITAYAPEDSAPGTYIGEILVSVENRTDRLPVKVIISLKSDVELDVIVETLTKQISPGDEAKFHVTLYNLGANKRFNSTIIYQIKNTQTNKVVYSENETLFMEGSKSFIKSIKTHGNFTTGLYTILVEAIYHRKKSASTDTFQVIKPLFSEENIRRIVIITLLIVFLVFMFFLRRKYKEWKIQKARYIFPVDFNKLPKGDLWIGKVAETDEKAMFNMDDLTTHILIAGATGSGKSVTGSIFVEELLEHKIPVVVFDPTAQWTGFVKPCRDEKVLKYYRRFGLKARDTKSYTGMIYEITDPKVKIDFKKYMNPGEITVFALNKLKVGDYDEAVTNIIDTIFTQDWEESTKLKLVIVFDEVHRLLERYGGKGGYIALERACREFRKWGIGLIMISQVLSDFKEAIKGNVLTEIQMHTKSLGDLTRVETKYGLEYAKKVAREEIGIGMMQNPKYNEGIPWFISFRPPLHMPHKIPDKEMETYKEYNEIIEKLELEMIALEKRGKDVSDMKVELKLAKEKLKQGRFSMAEIYINSLKKSLGK